MLKTWINSTKYIFISEKFILYDFIAILVTILHGPCVIYRDHVIRPTYLYMYQYVVMG